MSLTDPLDVIYDMKHEFWKVLRGRETFYDKDRYLITFKSSEDAEKWANMTFPNKLVIVHKKAQEQGGFIGTLL